MANDLSFGADAPMTLQDFFSAAQTKGADQSFVVPRTSDTVTTNAIDGSAPIDNQAGSSWADVWKDTFKSVVGYAIAKDAQQNAIAQPVHTTAAQQAQAAKQSSLMPVLLVGGVVLAVVLLRKG